MPGSSALRIELVERHADIPLSAAQWNALVEQNETSTVFQTYEWFDAWWSTFGTRHRLFFLLLRRGGEIVGFAPLMIVRKKWGVRELQFVGTGNADYLDFIIVGDRDDALRAICEFLRQRTRAWNRFRLCNIPDTCSSRFFFSRLGRGRKLYVLEESRIRCPAMQIRETRASAAELISRYSMRRPLNWFKRRGQVRFRHVHSLEEIRALLPSFFEQHEQRWQAVGKKSLFNNAQQRAFYERLATTMQPTGWLLFSVVEFDGAPIAFHFGFDYAEKVIWYKPSFETRYSEHSPGLLLIRSLIEDALQRDRKEIDFTTGDEQFKERFANTRRHNIYLRVYHSRFQWSIAMVVRTTRRAAGQLMRQWNLRERLAALINEMPVRLRHEPNVRSE